jgi:hypothetical protein
MSILIGTFCAFYAANIAWLGFECWRAPLVDEDFNTIQEGKTLWEACYRLSDACSRALSVS